MKMQSCRCKRLSERWKAPCPQRPLSFCESAEQPSLQRLPALLQLQPQAAHLQSWQLHSSCCSRQTSAKGVRLRKACGGATVRHRCQVHA